MLEFPIQVEKSALSYPMIVDVIVLAMEGRESIESSHKRKHEQSFSKRQEFGDYVTSVLFASQSSLAVVILSLYYCQVLRNMLSPYMSYCNFRMFLTSLILASKFLEDHTYTNASWGKIGRLAIEEVNRLEKEFLHALGFRLYLDGREFQEWSKYWLSLKQTNGLEWVDNRKVHGAEK